MPAILAVLTQFNDAMAVVNALAPLIESHINGTPVTPDDVRAALAGKDAALAAFDAAIRKAEGG